MDFSEYGGKSDEWLALEASLPPPPDLPPDELKRMTNETRSNTAREEMKSLSPRISLADYAIPTRDGSTIEARTYRSSVIDPLEILPIYIHFHGGGFFFGTIDSEDATCSRMALEAEVLVVNVNYRHTPDFRYPTAWLDSEDALEWVYHHATEIGGAATTIIMGGVSAGAYLTASLMLQLDRTRSPIRKSIAGQVLMIPPLVHRDSSEPYIKQMKSPDVWSWKENEFAPILPVSRIDFYNSMLFPESPQSDDRRANPGLATPQEAARLPPATFGVCGLDPVRDEGLLFAKLLQENGVPTNVNVFKGLPHAFRTLGDKLPAGKKAWDEVMSEGIRWALTKPLPSSVLDIHVY